MNFDDYQGLQSAIAEELNRTDLAIAISGFIRLCESQTERFIRTREMLNSINLVVDNKYIDIPGDFLETRSFYLNTNPITPLDFVTIDNMAVLSEKKEVKPQFYTVVGNRFLFSETPSEPYSATLNYYQAIQKLSNTNPVNWLLTKHPDIYFYGSLINSAPYLKEDARLSVWGQLYQGAIEALRIADDRAQTASTNLKMSRRTF